ncbi:MAG: methyltransferase domain-containing protein [Bacillota bacterium]
MNCKEGAIPISVSEPFSVNSNIYASPENERFYMRIAAALADRIVSLNPQRILEVGAGTGAATVVLRRWFPAAEILATDPSNEMLAYNKKKPLTNTTFALLPAEAAAETKDRFGLVFGNICYHWFRPGTARTLAGLLDPGGVMAFSVPVSGPAKGDGNLILLRICREIGVGDRHGKHLLSISRLRREFAGLKSSVESVTIRETLSPAFFGVLLRARGSWDFLFGSRAELAEDMWNRLTTGLSETTLHWNIALVVARK